MRKKNTVVIKQRDEWSGLAQFLGDMIANMQRIWISNPFLIRTNICYDNLC